MDELAGIAARVGEHGERLARHDAEIAALRASTERLEAAIGDVRREVHDTRTELKSEMSRGFDRIESGLTEANERAHKSYTPEAAQQLADSRAARAVAWAVASVCAAAAIIAAAIALWPHH